MSPKAKRKIKYAVPIEGRFTPITHDEQDSLAYCELNGNSAKLHAYLKRAARTKSYHTGVPEREVEFDFTYSEAKRRGFSESTFIRAVKELWAKGFLDVVERGGLRGMARSNSKYRLSSMWKTYRKGWDSRERIAEDPFKKTTEPKKGDTKW